MALSTGKELEKSHPEYAGVLIEAYLQRILQYVYGRKVSKPMLDEIYEIRKAFKTLSDENNDLRKRLDKVEKFLLP